MKAPIYKSFYTYTLNWGIPTAKESRLPVRRHIAKTIRVFISLKYLNPVPSIDLCGMAYTQRNLFNAVNIEREDQYSFDTEKTQRIYDNIIKAFNKWDWFYVKLKDKMGNVIGETAVKRVDSGRNDFKIYIEDDRANKTIFEIDRSGNVEKIIGHRGFHKRLNEIISGLECTLSSEKTLKEDTGIKNSVTSFQMYCDTAEAGVPGGFLAQKSKKIFDYVRSEQEKNGHFSLSLSAASVKVGPKGVMVIDMESIEHKGNMESVFIGYYIKDVDKRILLDWLDIDKNYKTRHWKNLHPAMLEYMLATVIETFMPEDGEKGIFKQP